MKTAILRLLLFMAILAALCSCKGMNAFSGNYGQFIQDPAVEAKFLQPVLNPGYDYFTYGPGDFPDVLLGIDKRYSLEPGVFNMAALSAESMKRLVSNMQHRAVSQTDILRGFSIVDEKGNKIGEWYGPFLFRSVVQVKDGVVSISYPDFPNRPFGRPSPDDDMM